MQSDFIMNLRFKIIFSFFGLSAIGSITLAYEAYRILEARLFLELRDKVGVISQLGARTIDREPLVRLIERQSEELTEKEVDRIEESSDYRTVSDQLNFIRNTQRTLIRYIYIVTPTENKEIARYLVDGDVLTLKAEANPEEEISHFNSEMEIVDFPILQEALSTGKPLVEKNYSYDEAFNVNSVSGYGPILNERGKLVALLGVDMADIEVRSALADVTNKSIIIAGIALLLSFFISILLGTMFTRGILYLDNVVRTFAEKDFTIRSQLDSNDEVGRLSRSFNFMAETIQNYNTRLEGLLAAYGKFVPHGLLKLIGKQSILDVELGNQTQKEMAILFADIRSFTILSESLTPEENFNFLNGFLSRIGPEIRAHDGIIDKYIGDAVMALFPQDPDHALDAAIAMQKRLVEYNVHRSHNNYSPIKIGIGIHFGKVMLGIIGETERMDGTVISDTVNLASRLESLTKVYNTPILVSETLLRSLKSLKPYFYRFVDKVCVVGKTQPISIYEIFNTDEETVFQLKKETNGDYMTAIKHYHAKRFHEAKEIFTAVFSKNRDDRIVALYIERIDALLEKGVPSDWNGITYYDAK